MIDRLRRLDRPTALSVGVVLLCAAAAVAHQTWSLWTWYIEDAAISFAYARHLAEGHGLVPWVGGERIEGYSNPTWVLLLAAIEACGGDAMIAAKWIQGGLAFATVWLCWGIARESLPADARAASLLAPLFLAAHPQFAIWGASGLENALFSALLAGGLWRLLVEARRDDAWPISALCWWLLGMSRPEAFAYTAVAAAFTVAFAWRRGVRWLALWFAAFGLPTAAWHGWRYSYFAYPWPQTYYAKLETKDPNVLRWIPNRGWAYVRDWGVQTWAGAFVPVWIAGAAGVEGWRVAGAAAAILLVATGFLLPEQLRFWIPVAATAGVLTAWRAAERRPRPLGWQVAALALGALVVGGAELARANGLDLSLPKPTWWNAGPPWLIVGGLTGAGAVGIGGRPGWRGRLLCWVFCGLSLGFAIQALGDWMKGFRWFSLAAVPASVLLAAGTDALARACADWLRLPRLAPVFALATWGGWLAAGIETTRTFAAAPETTPKMVRARVQYMSAVADRLKLDEPIRDLDVDQGAHLWWSDWQMYDIAGLIDVPFAQHRFERAFVKEYVFGEVRPHFAHLHGTWASTSRIPSFPEWKQQYVEIPGYGAAGNQLHIGNHIRRDLVLVRGLTYPADRRIPLSDGVTLVGWSVPAAQAAPGGHLRVELGLSSAKRADNENFRVLLFLASADGSRLASWDVAPGYDWIKPADWAADEVFRGQWDLPLPSDLPPGRYDLGVVVLSRSGAVAAPTAPTQLPPGAVVGGGPLVPARFAAGELRFPGVVTLAPRDAVVAAAEAARDDARTAAADGRCDDAAQAWWTARVHLPRDKAWWRAEGAAVTPALGACYAASAATADDPLRAIAQARRWAPSADAVRAAVRAYADAREAEGAAARAADDWETAFAAYRDAVTADPTRAWARRYAEEARALRLGIDPASKAQAEADRKARQQEIEARRNKAKAAPPRPPPAP